MILTSWYERTLASLQRCAMYTETGTQNLTWSVEDWTWMLKETLLLSHIAQINHNAECLANATEQIEHILASIDNVMCTITNVKCTATEIEEKISIVKSASKISYINTVMQKYEEQYLLRIENVDKCKEIALRFLMEAMICVQSDTTSAQNVGIMCYMTFVEQCIHATSLNATSLYAIIEIS